MDRSRRAVLRAGGAAVATGLAGCSFSVGTGPGRLLAISTGDGTETWTSDVGDITGGPLLADGTIYVGADETLRALSPADGSERWSVELDVGDFPKVGRPTVVGDTVLAPVAGTLAALSAADGGERWRFEAGGDADVWHTPPVANGTVVVGAGKADVYGVSLADGTETWRTSGENLDVGSATVADSRVVLGSRAGSVRALDVSDGSDRWTFDTEEPVRGTPAVGAGTVFVGTEGRRVHALSAADGSELWSADTSGGDLNVSTGHPETRFVGGVVYIEDNDVLYAVEAGSREQWTFDVDGDYQMSVADGAVYLAAELSSTGPEGQSENWGQVYALDRRRGSERWTTNVGGKGVRTPPGVGSDAVYVGQDDGKLHSLSRADGDERWVHEADGEIENRRPIVAGGVVVVTTE